MRSVRSPVIGLVVMAGMAIAGCGGDSDDAPGASTDERPGAVEDADGAAEGATDGTDERAAPSAEGEGATIVVDGTTYVLSEVVTCLVVPVSPPMVQLSGASHDGSVRVTGALTSALSSVYVDLDIGAEKYQVLGVTGDLEVEVSEDGDLAVADASGTMERADGATVSFELTVACRA